MRAPSGTVFSPDTWTDEPLQLVIPSGVYRAGPLNGIPTAPQNFTVSREADANANLSSSSGKACELSHPAAPEGAQTRAKSFQRFSSAEPKRDDAALPTAGAQHSGAQETWKALRVAAAERALRCLQKENDELKRSIIAYKNQQHSLQGVVNKLRSELEAMGKTVMEQNATLSGLSYTVQRYDPYHLIKEKRMAKVKALRHKPSTEATLNCVEALQAEKQMLKKQCKEKDSIISNLKKLLSKAQERQTKVPESIDVEEPEVLRSAASSCEPVAQEANAAEGLQRVIAALNQLLDRYEGFSQPSSACGRIMTEDSDAPENEIFTVCIRILSCADLVYPRDFVRGLSSDFRLYVVVRGPFGRNVLFKTPPHTTHNAFPMFSGGPSNEGRFRVPHDIFGRLELEVWTSKYADTTIDAVLFGRASVPVNALLSNFSKGSRPPSRSTSEDGQLTTLYNMKLFDPSKEQQVVGEICFEVEVRKAQPIGRLSASSVPAAHCSILDFTDPQSLPVAVKAEVEPMPRTKVAAAAASSAGSTGTASFREILRDSSDNTASPSSVEDEDQVSHRSNAERPLAEAAPEGLTEATQLRDPAAVSCELLPSAQPLSVVNLYIYVKEGFRFTEGREDEVLEELIDYGTRVLVWIDEQLVFTVPEVRGNLRMRWSSEDAAFITTVELSKTVRFDVQAIRGDSKEDHIGTASVKLSEVLTSRERSATLKLPVILAGLQCGSLVVEFCKSSK